MPNWKIHLEVAKELNKDFKLSDSDFSLFLLGNILPDINNCYIVKEISSIKSHKETHFQTNNKNGYVNFHSKYKDNFDNPLILGYYVHLFTDNLWNLNFYETKEILFPNYKKNTLRAMKQHDFRVYNSNFNIYNFLEKQTDVYEKHFFLYSEKELDKLFINSIQTIKDTIKS